MATTTAPQIIHSELRRTPKPKGILFEVLHEGQVIGSRTSGSFDFHGAIYYRRGGRDWNVYSYYGRPDLLAAGLRKAQQDIPLAGQLELLVATVAPAPPARERSIAFNQAYPIGTPVFYQTPRGKQVATFTTGTSWDSTPGPEGKVFVELAPAKGLPPFNANGWDAYQIEAISPNPDGTPGPPYGTVEALIDLLGRAFHINLLDEQRTQAGDFARQVCAANLVERLRSQLSDYLVCQALGAPVGKVSFQAFANPGPGFLVGLWNAHDYATSRAEAEVKLTLQSSAL